VHTKISADRRQLSCWLVSQRRKWDEIWSYLISL